MPKKETQLKPKRGRPKSVTAKSTISFRILELWREEFRKLAAAESKKAGLGREVTVSELYAQALGEYLRKKGCKVSG